MSDKIEVKVAPTAFLMASGESVEASVTLRNRGQTVDQFTISIDGLHTSWYTLPISSVSLFPKDQDSLKIMLHPPKIAETKAGSFPFRLEVISQENSEDVATVELAIQIQALPGLELSISPPRVAGRKAAYSITVDNTGNSKTPVTLKAADARGRLRYDLQPKRLTVPGGGSAEVTLQVRLGWLAFFGGEKGFDFQVKAMPEGGLAEEVKAINGQFVRTPWYQDVLRVGKSWYRTLSKVRLPWLARPPAIVAFGATTDDKREFKLSWSVKRAAEVKLDNENVTYQGERMVLPPEATKYVLTASNKYGSLSQTFEVTPLPLPKPKVSERIRVSLSPMQFQVQAGGAPVQATLEVQNLGETVDKFLVEIEGLDETWYSRSASSVSLFPRATEQVQISFQPPKKQGVRSRAYPFAVTVRSQSTSEEATIVAGQLDVLPLMEFKLGVHPVRVSCHRKCAYRITLANVGVTDIPFTLSASDLEEGCRFSFKNEKPVVAAWDTVEVPVVTKPKRGSVVGEKKRYDVILTATADTGNAQSVNCELNHNPFFASWRAVLRLMTTVIVLGAIVAGIFLILNLGGGFGVLSRSPQTFFDQLLHGRGAVPSVPSLAMAPSHISPANGAKGVSLTPTFTWGAVSGADHYAFYIKDTATGAPVFSQETLTGTSFTMPSGILSEGKSYTWSVKAGNAGGWGPSSAASVFTTSSPPSTKTPVPSPSPTRVPAPAMAPSHISPASGATGVPVSPTFAWNAVSGADHYGLYIRDTATSALVFSQENITGTSFTIPSGILSRGKAYAWSVKAGNASGWGPLSTASSFATPALPPPAPAMAPSHIGPPNGATGVSPRPPFAWNAVSGADHYGLYIRDAATSALVFSQEDITGTLFMLPSMLGFGKTYRWNVRAGNASGWGPYSSIWTFTTRPPPTLIPVPKTLIPPP